MPWTPSRAAGTAAFVVVTAGAALALSAGEPDPLEERLEAASSTTTEQEPSTSTSPSSSAPPTTARTTTTTEAPLDGPVRLLATSRFDLRGVGTVEAGMSVDVAEVAAGRRFRLTPIASSGGRCSTAAPDGLDGLTFVVAGDRVVRAQATAPTFVSVSGVGVGSTVDEVRRAYPGRLTEAGRRGDLSLTIAGRGGADADFGIRFESDDGRTIARILSGSLDALAVPTGCA